MVVTGAGHAPCLDLAIQLTHQGKLIDAVHVGGLDKRNAGDFVKFLHRELDGQSACIKVSDQKDGTITCHLVDRGTDNAWLQSKIRQSPDAILKVYKRGCNPPSYSKQVLIWGLPPSEWHQLYSQCYNAADQLRQSFTGVNDRARKAYNASA